MTPSELEQLVDWDANGLGEAILPVGLFGEEVPFLLFPAEGAASEVTARMADTVADVLRLAPDQLPRVKQMLWDEANFAFQVADYGIEAEAGETPLQAHLRAFEIHSPEDAWRKSTVHAVHVTDGYEGRFAELKIATGAENNISIIVRDGRIVDWDDDGTFLGWFDEDEQAATKKRAKVLG